MVDLARVRLAKVGLWPNLVLAKLGLAKLGLGKRWFGQTWFRPKLVWPKLAIASVFTTCHWFCKLWEFIQCLLSWSTVRLQLLSRILHDFVVKPFPLVLGTFTIDLLELDHRSKVQVFSSTNLSARTTGQIVLPVQVSLFLHGRICFLHTNLRLLRKYWADWQ